jgi:hypothetical protein
VYNISIGDLPTKKMVIFHRFLGLLTYQPKGTYRRVRLERNWSEEVAQILNRSMFEASFGDPPSWGVTHQVMGGNPKNLDGLS